MVVYSSDLRRNITLQDICFQPMLPENKNCAITSPLEYFQGNETILNSKDTDEFGTMVAWYVNRLFKCASSPTSVDKVPLGGTCLSSSGIPMPSNLVFGGYSGDFFNASTAIVMTFLVNDSVSTDSLLVNMAKEWELAFLNEIRQWIIDNPDVNVSYQAQRSVEDELTRQSNADVFTVIISYLVMFLYVSLCLGSYRSIYTVLVDIKLTLGLGGVLIVVVAIVTSVGIWSWAKVPASLIIIEVIPFLVLAVGVDNIFIMVQDFELDGDGHKGLVPKVFLPRFRNFFGENSPNRQLDLNNSPGQSINYDEIEDDDEISTIPIGEDASTFLRPHERARAEIIRRVCRTMARVGPSIFLSSLSETCAFFCGTISSMPAVKVFSMYAGLAIMINFLMQITVFVALLTLDARRTVARRLDICCCVSIRYARHSSLIH
ncbi:NPC intracellular cholesterol transporter 1 [Cichlidogyrus casuarinus]|uniref:NPC intracellular cholesterol transporter 1 n=1 Tax=Cichlidogyrus casuarinus TaxID=1844966 RepID=A0ABD2QF48_9PLAT